MPTLLLRLAAPLQSWGSGSKFETRTTEKMPTKSGVVGMLAAALGMRRDEDPSRLSALKFGVRTDREGEDITDFHTAHSNKNYYVAKESSYVTYRHYLSDAVFLVGLEGDKEFLRELEQALKNPKFPLFLGRRSCPPTLPIVIGIREESLENALCNEKPLDKKFFDKERTLRIRIETNESGAGMVQDVPVSFDIRKREYGYRKVKEFTVLVDSEQTEHDAMSELG